MSQSQHPTAVNLRRHRLKKRTKLRHRIAAAPAADRPALEARLQKTYSVFHLPEKVKPVPTPE